ncbi:MAG: poly(A) polymerase [Bdellovibrio sp.]|nr:poly(A) polymerase [Bdellovibrio sp.]
MSAPTNTSLLKHYTQILRSVKSAIDPQAVGILKRLKESGFQAYLVGGGVRDLLVNLKPKDFDIATNAAPNEVRKKVPYCFIIGRRFKLVHARRGDQIFEIATFRRPALAEEIATAEQDENAYAEENFFGNIEEDSFRRDFTINSLFYDPIDEEIIDHCHGLEDIKSMTLRMIGEPKARLIEDPIRMLRAIRLSQKLQFTIEPSLREAILSQKDELKKSAPPRRREEWVKFFRLPHIEMALMEMFDLGVFETVIPSFHALFSNEAQREEFLCYVRRINYVGFNLADTTELFSAVLHAYLWTVHPQGFNIDSFIESEKFLLFTRDELGIFKAEMGTYFQAAQFISSLKKKDTYLKKGERRQRSMVFHATFVLSLKLAYLANEISPAEFLFWLNERERLGNMTETMTTIANQ